PWIPQVNHKDVVYCNIKIFLIDFSLVITSYLNDYTNYSYRTFLNIYREIIIASASPSSNWQRLDNSWAGAFLKKAKISLDANSYADLKRKTDKRKCQSNNGSDKENLDPSPSKRTRSIVQEQKTLYVTIFYANLAIIIVEFDILVAPKRIKTFKWVVDVNKAAIEDLKNSIIAMHHLSEMNKNGASLTITCNSEKYIPQNNSEFQNILQLFVSKGSMIFTVSLGETLPFSKWSFRKICDLYGIGEVEDPQLSAFPLLNCGCVKLEGEREKSIIKHIMSDLSFRYKYIPIGNEASKVQYVGAYLVAISAFFEDKLIIRTEKYISGPNGHGPVDFALVSSQTSEVICVIEVKAKDLLQGIAQNTVQCESVLMKGRKNVLGIITDSEKWYFLKCSLDSNEKPNFSLSKPLVVVYSDDDMEKRVKQVLGHIVWLLNDVQKT
ncbi:3820_t:CDS:2, partial [Cetraspora pellucida]